MTKLTEELDKITEQMIKRQVDHHLARLINTLQKMIDNQGKL